MSLLRKILLFVKSVGVKVGGGEAGDVGAVDIGWACVSSVGGGTAVWTFPLEGKGAVGQGYGGKAYAIGGVGV